MPSIIPTKLKPYFAMKKISYLIAALLLFVSSFTQAQLSSSNLPILLIDTQGGVIRDEPKITATLKLIYNGAGKRNALTDIPSGYNGKIGIEYRGSTSQMFPKKPYGFELQDDSLKSIDAALLGMPKESDWILFASYNEKSLLHNAMAMKMARDMGVYASRTQHVELVVNGKYEGVYVLMEKVKRGSGRVNIGKMTDKDNAGDALTGGYIFKVDKTTGSTTGLGWNSKVPPPNALTKKTYYQYDYPKSENITPAQRAYLPAVVDSAEAVLNGSNFLDKTNGYRKHFDAQSFAKLLLINEASKNVDGYRISTFLHKDKNSKDRRIKAGPAWDYDLAFGNADYYNAIQYTGWSYLMNDPSDNWQVPFHWKRMLEDTTFTRELRTEYQRLRRGAWKTATLHAYIDSLSTVLNEAQQRNFVRWPILGQYVWPNPQPIASSWSEEVRELKNWLQYRLEWMDVNLPGVITALEPTEKRVAGFSVTVSPNPFNSQAQLLILSPKRNEVLLEIIDMNGRAVGNRWVYLEEGSNQVTVPVDGMAGNYLLRLHTAQGAITKKLVKQ